MGRKTLFRVRNCKCRKMPKIEVCVCVSPLPILFSALLCSVLRLCSPRLFCFSSVLLLCSAPLFPSPRLFSSSTLLCSSVLLLCSLPVLCFSSLLLLCFSSLSPPLLFSSACLLCSSVFFLRARVEIVGACYSTPGIVGVFYSGATILLPRPQHESKSWAHFSMEN